MGTEKLDPEARPEMMAFALSKAAIQTTQRALFTAQIAADALRRAANEQKGTNGEVWRFQDAERMDALRDALLDAFKTIPEKERKRISAFRATLTSDELIDLLALSVQG
jgi:hypothetical protein